VGHEPSGLQYNALKLNPSNLPHNPLVSSGAIMVCSLTGKDLEESKRFSETVEYWKKLSGGKRITYDNSVFLSEKNCSDNNTALAYLMKSKNVFPNDIKVSNLIEYYI
jgi:glutaminase